MKYSIQLLLLSVLAVPCGASPLRLEPSVSAYRVGDAAAIELIATPTEAIIGFDLSVTVAGAVAPFVFDPATDWVRAFSVAPDGIAALAFPPASGEVSLGTLTFAPLVAGAVEVTVAGDPLLGQGFAALDGSAGEGGFLPVAPAQARFSVAAEAPVAEPAVMPLALAGALGAGLARSARRRRAGS